MKIADLQEWTPEKFAADQKGRKWLNSVIVCAEMTEHDYDAGTAQFCGTFALVLCRLIPGATPVMVVPTDEYGDQLGTSWMHAAVEYCGGLFDVYGEGNEDEMIYNFVGGTRDDDGNFRDGAVIPIDEATLIKYIGTDEKSYSRRWYQRWEQMIKAGMAKAYTPSEPIMI